MREQGRGQSGPTGPDGSGSRSDAIPGFFGRAEELAWLRGLWAACTARDPSTSRFVGGPRAAFVVAESGIGKSRLVQALYQQLTVDPTWDPPEVNYWPDAFHDQGVQLRVVPDMKGHVPKGPPRFAWLGTRWTATEVRNVSDRRSNLPELRESMTVHAEILREHGSLWQDATGRIGEAIRRHGLGEAISQLADAAVPFGGLLSKIVAGATRLAKDRLAGPRSAEQAHDEAKKTLVDEVCECLHALDDGPGGLPTVLWLDDAQWIDGETLEFVRRIWRTAQQRRWPLLLVVTHWEREWRELARSEAQGTLRAFEGSDGVEVRVLEPASSKSLEKYLRSSLPGLTSSQQALLLDKAAGNFLTMVENVGQLRRVPANFVDRDTGAALAPVGERKVREWESDRQKRVEQRFSDLAPELQELLGWASHLGMRFLQEVVEDFAERVAGQASAGPMLSEAVDPLVILGEPSEHLREFRDKAFHHVAARHFRDYGEEHAESLLEVLRTHLVEWVNNSFDEKGDLIEAAAGSADGGGADEAGAAPDSAGLGGEGRPADTTPCEEAVGRRAGDRVAPHRAAVLLDSAEQRDLLGMAVMVLPLSDTPDWSVAEDRAALRARLLAIWNDAEERMWDRVLVDARVLASVPWPEIDTEVASIAFRERLASIFQDAGAFDPAMPIRQDLLDRARKLEASLGTLEIRRDVSVSLERLGDIAVSRGDHAEAERLFSEMHVVARELKESLGTPESRRVLSVALSKLGNLAVSRGDLAESERLFLEMHVIARELEESLGTPESRRDLSVALSKRGDVAVSRGDLAEAERLFAEQNVIDRGLAESLRTPASQRDLSISLERLGDVAVSRGDLAEAERMFSEMHVIARELEESLGTPESRRDLSVALSKLGNLAVSRGDLAESERLFSEMHVIARELHERLGTPESQRDLSISLERLGDLAASRGDFAEAERLFAEKNVIDRGLAESLGTPASQRDLSISLERLGALAMSRGDLAEAERLFSEMHVIARDLKESLGTSRSRRELAVALSKLGDVAVSRGDLAEAERLFSEMHAIARELEESLGTPASGRDLWSALNKLGNLAASRGDFAEAVRLFARGLGIARGLMESLGTPQSRWDLSASLFTLGDIAVARGDLPGALVRYRESCRMLRQLLEDHEHPVPWWADVFLSIVTLCRDVAAQAGDAAACLPHAAERFEIARHQADGEDSPLASEFLLSHLLPVLWCHLELGQTAEALEATEQITPWASQLEAAFDDPAIDNAEQQLDATTLERCAEAWALAARAAEECESDAGKAAECRTRAYALRDRIEVMKAASGDGGSGGASEGD